MLHLSRQSQARPRSESETQPHLLVGGLSKNFGRLCFFGREFLLRHVDFIVVLGLSLVAACRNFSSWRSMGFGVLGLGCRGAWALAAPRHVGS